MVSVASIRKPPRLAAPLWAVLASILSVLLAAGPGARASVVVSEIMYDPPQGGDYQYVELHNTADSPVSLSGWAFTQGIEYVFPEGTSIAPRGYVVVAKSREKLRAAHPDIPEGVLLGDFAGALANEGESLVVLSPDGLHRDQLVYDDELPWDFLAAGFGASLERVCMEETGAIPNNWRASRVPASIDEHGGSPGAPNGVAECPPPIPERPPVHISEILYAPVLEESLVEEHEFIEIHNSGAGAIELEGWRIVGDVEVTFRAGSSIPAGGYRVVAKSRERLVQVAAHGLTGEEILGEYEGSLPNNGGKVAIVDAEGRGVDAVSYDDEPPWPVGADALGAGESWLPRELLPLSDHRYMGRSLERVTFAVPASEIANWAPSPLDGATPGRPNASARPTPLPVVERVEARPRQGTDPSIRADAEVLVLVRFSPSAPSGAVELEHFVDDVIGGRSAPPTSTPMEDDGKDGDLRPGDGVYSCVLPGLPEDSLVRYRVRADRGEGVETLSPRPSDPNPWYAYFVSPAIDTETRVYQILISPASWGRMWTNIQGNRVSGCVPSPTWDAQVPAVLIHEGRVIDVRVRYQGSRWNRMNGRTIAVWPYPRPSTGPVLALSWRIGMPRYAQLEGKDALILNKLTQGCPGYNAAVGYRLFEAADLPGCQTRFVRLHVNGGYYHYMIELERPSEPMMRRYHREMRARYPLLPREEVGHLFKSMGYNGDEGPWGWGDERLLASYCGHTAETRYRYTYERKTHEWDDHAELIQLIADLNAARRSLPSTAALRAFFEERFDLDLLLSYIAIINWSVPFDDMFQNHFLYQRLSDGKWIIFPWDLDQDFGVWQGATSSLYMGMQGDASNRSGWWNYLKDAFLRSYRTEYQDRLLLLNNTILHPDNVSRLIDEATAAANPAEAARAPAGLACSFPGSAAVFRSFAAQRFAIVNQQLAGAKVDAGPSSTVFAGSVVRFDASASTPAPGPDVPYAWDNGMEGDRPTFVYDEPGEYVVTLTVTVRGIPFRDDVTVTVLPRPERVHAEADGRVVLEAESHHAIETHGATKAWWELASGIEGFSGTGAMEAKHTTRQSYNVGYWTTAPELRYAIRFESTGTYRVWIRGRAPGTQSDSCHVGIDGRARTTTLYTQFEDAPDADQWAGGLRTGEPQTLEVPAAGIRIFSIWMRESGLTIDKIVLNLDQEYVPEDEGPPESPRVPPSGGRAFVRGDADGDSRVNITDAVAVLLHLFGGMRLECEDHGDVDDSGEVSIADAIGLLDFLFRRGPAPRPPFPRPGHDPTPDDHPCGDA